MTLTAYDEGFLEDEERFLVDGLACLVRAKNVLSLEREPDCLQAWDALRAGEYAAFQAAVQAVETTQKVFGQRLDRVRALLNDDVEDDA